VLSPLLPDTMQIALAWQFIAAKLYPNLQSDSEVGAEHLRRIHALNLTSPGDASMSVKSS
jgi:hypothetical protein